MASRSLLSHDATSQCLSTQVLVPSHSPPTSQDITTSSCHDSPSSSALLDPCSPCCGSNTPTVEAVLPSIEVATLGETGSLIRSSLNDIDGYMSDEMISVQSTSLDESGYISADEEEPEKERQMPCDNCCELVKELKAEIVSLKKRQLPGEWIPENQINSPVKLPLRCPKYIVQCIFANL